MDSSLIRQMGQSLSPSSTGGWTQAQTHQANGSKPHLKSMKLPLTFYCVLQDRSSNILPTKHSENWIPKSYKFLSIIWVNTKYCIHNIH